MIVVESNIKFLENIFRDEEIKYLHYPCGAENFANTIKETDEKLTMIINIFPFSSPEEYLLGEINELELNNRLSKFGNCVQEMVVWTAKRPRILSIISNFHYLNVKSLKLINSSILNFNQNFEGIADIECLQGFTDDKSDGITALQNYYYTKSIISKASALEVERKLSQAEHTYWHQDLKLLILDLDNTLWPGILIEDGTDVIIDRLENTPKGNAYLLIQKIILRLKNDFGLLLIAVSKNEHDLVQKMFTDSRSLLTENDFVSINASWEAKSVVCKQVLKQVNLLSKNSVFIDDNPYELGEVTSEIKEINTIQFDGNPFKLVQKLSEILQVMQTKTITNEDKNRTELYRLRSLADSAKRSSTKDITFDSGDKLILEPTDRNLPRIKSLLTKTNQFNANKLLAEQICVTSRDFSEYDIFAYRVTDNYGDHGIVAVLGGKFGKQDKFNLDLFVMSCRVFERGIENKLLDDIRIQLGQINKSVSEIRINFTSNGRNLKFLEFVDKYNDVNTYPKIVFQPCK